MQWPGDGYIDDFKDEDPNLETGFARPREPIRVTMVQDEELSGRNGAVLEEHGDEDDAEKELPPPPPAYGLWRSSVVCLPPLIPFTLLPFPYHNITHTNPPFFLSSTESRPQSHPLAIRTPYT